MNSLAFLTRKQTKEKELSDVVQDIVSINYSSKDWYHLKQILHRYVDDATSKIVGDISKEETDKIRGYILLAKTVLSLEEQARAYLAQNRD